MSDERLLHVAVRAEFEARRESGGSAGRYAPAAFPAEGFVHLCLPPQLPGVLERYFRGRDDLLLLTLDARALDGPLVFEDSTGRGETFPHLYGTVPLAAVIEARPLRVDDAGAHALGRNVLAGS